MHYCRCYSSFHFNIYALSLSLFISPFLVVLSTTRPQDPMQVLDMLSHALIFGWFDSQISIENNKNPPSQLSFTSSFVSSHIIHIQHFSPSFHLFTFGVHIFISS